MYVCVSEREGDREICTYRQTDRKKEKRLTHTRVHMCVPAGAWFEKSSFPQLFTSLSGEAESLKRTQNLLI